MSIRGRIDEIVDYYDQDLEYVDERSYIQIKMGENIGIYTPKASGTSRYESTAASTRTSIAGYDNLYIQGLDDKYLTSGQTAYIYLTFRVEKDKLNDKDTNGLTQEEKDRLNQDDWIKLDEYVKTGEAIGVGKENIAEINGYSTIYAPGTQVPNVGDVGGKAAGIVDVDSNPGNLDPNDVPKDGNIKYENFEDDTDKAPNLRVILYRDDDTTRVISGVVWEDERTKDIESATIADGNRTQEDQNFINGVTVQLVELMENGTEFVWRQFGGNAGSGNVESESPIINALDLIPNYEFDKDVDKRRGQYAFKSFAPGKYVVRFIYGDTIRTVLPSALGGDNSKSYNGQDYKSTTYQEGIAQNNTYTWRTKSTWNKGQETLGAELTKVTTFNEDASNNETANATVKAENQKGYLYDIAASDAKSNVSDAKDIESRRNTVISYSDKNVENYKAEVLASHKADYTTMNDRTTLVNDLISNTQMTAETGLMVIELEYNINSTDGNKKDNQYKITNVDLGLEERPKAQLAIEKEITNVKLTLANGSILFDAQQTASNVLWQDHKDYITGYTGNFMDPEKFGNIVNIRTKNASKFGLIQLSMDEELMHGATIKISYKITVRNVGETDYKGNRFYYNGIVPSNKNEAVVKTTASQLIDYVANNLQFYVADNPSWRLIKQDEIEREGLVHNKLKAEIEKYNTIITTSDESAIATTPLVPAIYKEKVAKNDNSVVDKVSDSLVLTQLITAENDTDDLTYRNIVEMVRTSNNVGRRNEYSVAGNQDPSEEPQEIDSDRSEIVRILPPFGETGIYYIIAVISAIVVIILIGGIIFIKKKVLKR